MYISLRVLTQEWGTKFVLPHKSLVLHFCFLHDLQYALNKKVVNFCHNYYKVHSVEVYSHDPPNL